MQNNQQLATLAFVLVIGLLGGYMLAQHVGGVADEHRAAHEQLEAEQADAASADIEHAEENGEAHMETGADIHVE